MLLIWPRGQSELVLSLGVHRRCHSLHNYSSPTEPTKIKDSHNNHWHVVFKTCPMGRKEKMYVISIISKTNHCTPQ